MQKVQIVVTGRVQGVAFRAYTRKEATRLLLNGYVRNLSDGSVEIWAEGDRHSLDSLVQWAGSGSPAARVDDLQVTFSDATGSCEDFQIRY